MFLHPLRQIAILLVFTFVLQSCASNGRRSMERGKKHMEAREYSRALLEFRNAQRHFPKDADVLYHVALAYLATGEVQNAVRYLRAATEADPKHVGAQVRLSELMALADQDEIMQEAEKRARLAVQNSNDNAEAMATLAFAELRQGKTLGAERRLTEIIDKYPQALKAVVVLSNFRMSQNKPEEAEVILKRFVSNNPKTWEGWFSLSRFYLLTKNFPEAEKATRKVIEIDPQNELSLQDLAAIQIVEKKYNEAGETYKKLAAHPSKRYVSLHAVHQFQHGNRDEALKELEQVFRDNSKNRTVRNQMVAGYLMMKRPDQAEKLLNEALKENPRDVDALLQRGQIYLLAGKLDGLEADVSQVLKFKGDSGEAHYMMARLYRARLNPKNEQRELYEALKYSPNLLAARVDTAQHLIASGGGKAALDLLDAAPEDQKDSLAITVQRNWALFAMKDIARLREGIQKGYKFGRVPDVMLQEALILQNERKFTQARELMKEALKANPQDLRVLQILAESHLAENSKDPGPAIAEVKAVAEQNPKSARHQVMLGNWQVATGQISDARKSFEAAKAADPNFKGATLALAQIDLATGKYDQARQDLAKVASADPKDASATLLMAMIDERAGETEKAMNSYRKVVDVEPTNAIALNNLAYRLSQDAKRMDEALVMAQRAKESAPGNIAIDDTLGWIYYKKGLYSTAVTHLEAATAGPNPTPVRLFHLAMAYQKTGSKAKANDAFVKAYKIAPKLPEAEMAKQILGLGK